jgi:uncharacterized protein
LVADTLPLFPLGTVLFPGVVLPLHIFQPRYRVLIEHLMELPADVPREFGVVAIRHGVETGEHDDTSLYRVGCSAEMRQVTSHPDGRYDIVTVGRRRFRLHAVEPAETPYLTGRVEWISDQDGQPGEAERLAPNVLSAFRGYLRQLGAAAADEDDPDAPAGADAEQLPEDPTVLSHLVAASASLTVADRQRLLAAADTAGRLRIELSVLRRETALVSALHAVPTALADYQVEFAPN